jgi:hypothetical protein
MDRSLRFALSVAVLFATASAAADQIVLPARAPRAAAPAGIAFPQPIVVTAACSESEPNEQTGNASPMTLPAGCSGFASSTDASSISIDYGGGLRDGIEDLYSFSLASSARVSVSLAWTDTNADLDLFLFQPSGTSIDIIDASAANGSAPEAFTSPTLAPGTYYIGVSAFNGGSNYTLNVSQATSSSGCTDNNTTACLGGGRFRVRTTYDTGTQSGNGGAVKLTSDTGYFWFFGNANVEMVVKILDACSFNNRFWVFAGGLTDVGVSLNITDTQTGTTKTYSNTRGTAFKPIQDTDAFATCASVSCSYALAPPSQSFGTGGGTGSVSMTTTSGCGWSAASDSSWITITGGGSGSGNGTINFSVASNGGADRTGHISAGGQSATISQSGTTPTCSYLVSPTSASYGTSGGAGSVSVTAPAGCAWTASSSFSFINITSGSSGNGNGSVAYSVAANSGAARTGSMTIAGQTVTISQSGAPPASYNGNWSGATSQQRAFSFTVSNNAFTTWKLDWHATGSCGTVDGTTTVTYNTPLAISGSSFTLTTAGPTSITLNGTFSSTSSASGSFSVNYNQPFPACSASGSGTWTATKQ